MIKWMKHNIVISHSGGGVNKDGREEVRICEVVVVECTSYVHTHAASAAAPRPNSPISLKSLIPEAYRMIMI